MKSLNGLLFIVAGGLVIWIGATGRLPALAAALGMIKNAPGSGGTNTKTNQSTPDFSGVSSGSSSSASSPVPGASFFNQVGAANASAYKAIADANGNFYYNVLGLK